MREQFPRLVWCRVTGFYADGPLEALPGYDAAVAGHGRADEHQRRRRRRPAARGPAGGGHGRRHERVIGVLLALHESAAEAARDQLVDAALYDGGLSPLHPHAPNWFMSGSKIPQRTGNAHPNIYPTT